MDIRWASNWVLSPADRLSECLSAPQLIENNLARFATFDL